MPSSSRQSACEVKTTDTDHRIKMYSLAAAAAGVSMLALCEPAQGGVVVTKKNIPINQGVSIDLNNDGIADFEFSLTSSRSATDRHHSVLTAKELTGGKVVGRKNYPGLGPYASALVRGAKIGPSAHFSSSHGEITIERKSNTASTFGYRGDWYYVGSNRFLGVKFQIRGKTHYGWIRLTVDIPGSFQSTITGYAYETIANKKITAGETSASSAESAGARPAESQRKAVAPSLGMLALGEDGLSFWRQEEIPIP